MGANKSVKMVNGNEKRSELTNQFLPPLLYCSHVALACSRKPGVLQDLEGAPEGALLCS